MLSDLERRKVDKELRHFTTIHFERPVDCRNLDQTRFYIRELCDKIQECESSFNYVPDWVYKLLAQYNHVQTNMLYLDFRNSYSY